MNILFLNENPLPAIYTRGTISGKELRLRAAIPQIDAIHVLCRPGPAVVSHRSEQTALEEKIIIHRLPSWPYYLAGIPLFIGGLYLSIRFKPATIEAESPIISGPAAIFIGKLLHIPSIIELRASYIHLIKYRFLWIPLKWKRSWVNWLQYTVMSHANAVIANSQTYHTRLKKMGISSVIINPGIQYNPDIPKISTHLPGNFTLGYLGRLVPEKGVDLFIQAIKLLDHQTQLPPFHVEIAGAGPQSSALVALVKNLHLSHRITFIGMIDNYTVLRHWHILVNPNTVNHPLEMVNVEAAYMRVPVVCFGNQLIPETVAHGKTGLKVQPKTATALATAIIKLLTQPKLFHQLQLNGPAFAQKYSFTDQVATLTSLYHDLNLL